MEDRRDGHGRKVRWNRENEEVNREEGEMALEKGKMD